MTLVADMATELTDLATEFTLTVKAEEAGAMLASVKLYVISSREGVAFSIAELT